MSSLIARLNLDASLPNLDAYRTTNLAGTVRFINASDALKLPAMDRLQGDLVHRSVLVEQKVNEIISSLASNPNFISFDSSLYLKADGSTPLSGPQAGQRPTRPEHLATKEYADAIAAAANVAITELAEAFNNVSQTAISFSDWVSHTWSAGSKQVISLAVSPGIADLTAITSVQVLEKINVSVATTGNPTPTPRYIIRPLVIGSKYGTIIDDIWYENGAVKVAFPNAAFFSEGYSGYTDVWPVASRTLRAVVTTLK